MNLFLHEGPHTQFQVPWRMTATWNNLIPKGPRSEIERVSEPIRPVRVREDLHDSGSWEPLR